jgi:hypothetical protein
MDIFYTLTRIIMPTKRSCMIKRNILTLLALATISLSLISPLWAETLTLTTYYPAPTGNYQTITTTGNLGVGTTTGGSKLSVNGGASFGSFATTAAPNGGLITSGNVGIGTAIPGVKLYVNGGMSVTNDVDIGGGVVIGGSLLVPAIATEGGVDLEITGDVNISGQLGVGGDIVAEGFVYEGSDERFKQNIEPITDALMKVQQLNGVTFNWIKDGAPDIGVIAQNVESVFPELVRIGPSGMKFVKYGNLVGALIEAIKEQQKQIDELKLKIKD